MSMSEKRFSLDSVKQDVQSFFLDDSHWAYQYGSRATSCNKDSVFYKRQVEVIFEDAYPHDVTGKAIKGLLAEGFLKAERRFVGKGKDVPIIFVCKQSRRYTALEIRERIEIVDRFSDDEVNKGVGKYAEILFAHMLEKNQFQVVDRHTKSFRGKTCKKSRKNLDFIVEKDGVSYGMEVKNTFDYMPQDEFEEKLDMCQFLGLLPVFPLRYPSPQQFELMGEVDGLALAFKTRFFPPGNQKLVTAIWNHFRLPVSIWEDILPSTEAIFLSYHHRQLLKQTSSVK